MRAHLRHDCGKYLGRGGFVAVQGLEPSDATLLLQEYANRTVNYDVIERYNISNPWWPAVFCPDASLLPDASFR